MKNLFVAVLLLIANFSYAQNFKYAFVTDTHIGTATGEEDLRRTVADINKQTDLDFVIVTGDITEMGTNEELKLAKEILSGLNKKFYVIPGNHDTGWSESGGVSFIKEFGYDKFTFDHNGFRFIACASGPYVRMSDGHIPRDATVWLDSLLKKTPKSMPVVFVNHYPIDNSLDNWYEVTDRIKTKNIQYAICGHGHQNKAYNFEGIEATMGRSNLRAKDSIGGYNIVNMTKDSVFFTTRKPNGEMLPTWRKIALKTFVNNNKTYERPDFSINQEYNNVKAVWTYHSNANVVNTPDYNNDLVIFGNSLGLVEALNIKTGKPVWTYQTQGAIYSSPLITWNKSVVFGSGDGNVYALSLKDGKLIWKTAAGKSVLGSPVIQGDTFFIGASDNTFKALDVRTGKIKWQFTDVEGTIVGKPLLMPGSKIIFGSWGRHLYALDVYSGNLIWKWNNGNGNRMLSPAMATPVTANKIIFIAAPDRVLTAIDANTGETLWRNSEAKVRESIGIATDGQLVYGKTMQDEIVAYKTTRKDEGIAWKYNAGYGYEHTPSDLIEKNGKLFFGTKNGTVYCIDPKKDKTLWAHKIDNSMVNTFKVIDDKTLLLSTMDGKVALIKEN